MPKISMTARMARAAGILLACLALAPGARADDLAARVEMLEARLAASMQTIERLSARVSELERSAALPAQPLAAAPAVGAASAPAADSQAKTVAALEASVQQISEGLSRPDPAAGLPLHGFADVGAAWTTDQDPLRRQGFNAGTLDIYLTPQIGDRVKALFELVLEHLPDQSSEFEAERLQIGYTVSDALTLWLGRFHNSIGLWNTLYHHGAFLQTSITRPRFIEFEDKGGIIPTHSAGLWGSGHAPTAIGRVSYDLYVANGPTIRDRSLDINTFTDDTSNKLVGFNAGIRPDGPLSGWTFGLHGLGANVNAVSSANAILSATRVRLGGAYFQYESDAWNLLGEYYRQHNRDELTSIATSNNLWFAQASHSFGAFVPYMRYERASLDPLDVYFRSLLYGRSYRRAVVGLRYDVNQRSAIKTELMDTREDATQLIDETGGSVPFPAVRYRGLAIEYSIAF
jgi:hypothetical protein